MGSEVTPVSWTEVRNIPKRNRSLYQRTAAALWQSNPAVLRIDVLPFVFCRRNTEVDLPGLIVHGLISPYTAGKLTL